MTAVMERPVQPLPDDEIGRPDSNGEEED